MTVERTLAIIKPDAWPQHGGAIITMVTEAGLEPLDVQALGRGRNYRLPGERFEMLEIYWEEFYAEHKGKPFFKSLVEFMASGPVLAMVLEGEDAIKRWRTLMGGTSDSRKAPPDSVRGRFGARLVEHLCPSLGAIDMQHTWMNGHGENPQIESCLACNKAKAAFEQEIADYPMWRNAVHGSDSPEAAAREIAFFFGG